MLIVLTHQQLSLVIQVSLRVAIPTLWLVRLTRKEFQAARLSFFELLRDVRLSSWFREVRTTSSCQNLLFRNEGPCISYTRCVLTVLQ